MISDAQKKALLKGRTITLDGQMLKLKQYIDKRAEEKCFEPSVPFGEMSPATKQWRRQYSQIRREQREEQDRHRKRVQELRAKMDAHVASGGSEHLKKLKAAGRRTGDPRPGDHPQKTKITLLVLSAYMDCIYEILHEEFDQEKWIGIPPPREFVRDFLSNSMPSDKEFNQLWKKLESHRKNRARDRIYFSRLKSHY
jgi:hypothetical protein